MSIKVKAAKGTDPALAKVVQRAFREWEAEFRQAALDQGIPEGALDWRLVGTLRVEPWTPPGEQLL